MGCNASRLAIDEDLLVATDSAVTLGKWRQVVGRKDDGLEDTHEIRAIVQHHAGGFHIGKVQRLDEKVITLRKHDEAEARERSTRKSVDEGAVAVAEVKTEEERRRVVVRDRRHGEEGEEENVGSPSFRIYFVDGTSDKTSDDEVVAAIRKKQTFQTKDCTVATNSEESELKAETKVVKHRRFGSLATRRGIYAILKYRYSNAHVHPHLTTVTKSA